MKVSISKCKINFAILFGQSDILVLYNIPTTELVFIRINRQVGYLVNAHDHEQVLIWGKFNFFGLPPYRIGIGQNGKISCLIICSVDIAVGRNRNHIAQYSCPGFGCIIVQALILEAWSQTGQNIIIRGLLRQFLGFVRQFCKSRPFKSTCTEF